MKPIRWVIIFGVSVLAYSQQQPNVAAQREAMKKLDFLVGKWSGNASVMRGPGQPLALQQTEEVQYKMDGLVMLVEGTGRAANGEIVFQALATISYDEQTSKYHFRAYNSGRYLDTELQVMPKGFAWGYQAGPVHVNNTMQVDAEGRWLETTETTMGSAAPRKSVEMKLRRLQ